MRHRARSELSGGDVTLDSSSATAMGDKKSKKKGKSGGKGAKDKAK